MPKPTRRPDELLDPRQFTELNEEFYAHSPAEYFRTRLLALAVVAAESERFDEIAASGLTYESLKIGRDDAPTNGADEEEEDPEGHRRFVITESQILKHHVVEVLVRLFIVHSELPPCPWLRLTDLRLSEFNRHLDAYLELDQEELVNQVATVFLGGPLDDAKVDDDEREEVTESLETLAGLMRHWVTVLKTENHLYNSAKHGLGVRHREDFSFQLDFGGSGEDFRIARSGPTLAYLSLGPVGEDELAWTKSNTFVQPDRAMAATHIAASMIDGLWSVARRRYLRAESAKVFLPGPNVLEVVQDKPPEGELIQPLGMNMTLAYFEWDPAPPTEGNS